MATITPIAYNNSGTPIPGTEQIGNLSIGNTSQDYGAYPSGYTFWATPDQDLHYVVAYPVPSGNHPNPLSIPCYVGFFKTPTKTLSDFFNLANYISNQDNDPQNFTSGQAAVTWLNNNGYWTSYVSPPTPTQTTTPTNTPTNTVTPTPSITTSVTPTNTPTNTQTGTPDVTPTPTPSNTPNLQGFNYTNFASTAGLTLLGNAAVSSNILFLTTAGNVQTGNVYRTTAIRYDRNFSAQWSTIIGGGTGADGYCVQWTSTNNSTGTGGGGVGLIQAAGTINAITFLTFTNNSYNWYKNNVLQSANPVSAGLWRQTLYFWGDYNHSSQTFELYWNTTNSKPVSPNKTFNSFSFDSGSYYMGFGAATGGSNDNHEILNWSLTFN